MKKTFFIFSILLLLCSISFFLACQKEHEGQNNVLQTEQVLSDEEFDAKIAALGAKLESVRNNEALYREGGISEAPLETAIIDIEATLNRGHGNATLRASDVKKETVNINIVSKNGSLSQANMQTIYNTAYNLWYSTYSNYNVEHKHAIALDIAKVDSLSSGNQINIYIGAYVGQTDNSSATSTPCISTFNESHYWSQKSQGWGLNTSCNPNLPAADKAINIELSKSSGYYNYCVYYTNITSNPILGVGDWNNSSLSPTYTTDLCIVFERMNSHYCAVLEDFNSNTPSGYAPIIRTIISETLLSMKDGQGYHYDFHRMNEFVYGKRKLKVPCEPKTLPPTSF